MSKSSQIKSEFQAPDVPEAPQGYEKLRVRINYSVDNWRDGVHWVGSEDDPRYPHCFTIQSPVPGSTSCWVPCVEDSEEKYPWELEFTVPAKLKSIMAKDNDNPGDVEEGADDETGELKKQDHDMTVVCCGDFLDEVRIAFI